MKVTTRMKVTPNANAPTLAFDLSRLMRVTEAKVNGRPIEVFAPESLRANLLRSAENMVILLVGESEFVAGQTYEIEFRHEGRTVLSAGNRVYFVSSRGASYPNRARQFALYD